MRSNRNRGLTLDFCGLLLLIPLLVLPFATSNVLVQSLVYQIAVGVSAAMGVYVMLRMGLLSFTVPAFMALGGYAAAILSKAGTTNLLALMAISVVVPALVAGPLGALVLRLRGVYFIFITFMFNEILQLVLLETPALTGGSNGISDVQPATMPGLTLDTPVMLVAVTVFIAIVATTGTLAITHRFRPEFSSIEENETLTESLGVAIWKYRTLGFIASGGISGLAGFALVNMLSTANPSSFSSWSVNNYIAYVFVGGRNSILGVVVGSILLVVLNTVFSAYSNLSAGLFGILLVAVLMLAPRGVVGSLTGFADRLRRVPALPGMASEARRL